MTTRVTKTFALAKTKMIVSNLNSLAATMFIVNDGGMPMEATVEFLQQRLSQTEKSDTIISIEKFLRDVEALEAIRVEIEEEKDPGCAYEEYENFSRDLGQIMEEVDELVETVRSNFIGKHGEGEEQQKILKQFDSTYAEVVWFATGVISIDKLV